jgi:Ca-activated chloride channel family protein
MQSVNNKALLILLALGLFSLGIDFSPEIASGIDDLVPEPKTPVQPPVDQPREEEKTNFSNIEKKDDWQYKTDKMPEPSPSPLIPAPTRTTVEKDESGMPFRYASGLLYGHTYKSLSVPTVANPVSLFIMLASFQSNLGGFHAAESTNTLNSFGSGSGNIGSADSDLGFETGGAQDVNNFRDNIKNDYLPLNKDISYEGLFHEYYFETDSQRCQNLFCPSYSKAVSKDPLSNETGYYTTIGLNSKLTQEEFERKDLNLVVVLDISGSMRSSFNDYYYDRFGNRHEVENLTEKSKLKVAQESLKGMTKHLRPNDRLGIVLYNGRSYKAKPLRKVGATDMDAIRGHIEEDISSGGSTNMDGGMTKATEMLEEYGDADQSEYENRMVFMTDAMPNIDTTSDEGLTGMAEENAENDIHTSFIGMGVDFNTDLVDSITSIEGANYFSVHSADQFKQRMDENFQYMVTPLVYDLQLKLDSEAFDIEKVYGSTAAEESTGRILKVNTLFPSPKKDGKTKGGVVLAKLEKTGESDQIKAEVTYETRDGETKQVTEPINFEQREPEYFESSGVRKAVLLSRYADLMKNWIDYERRDMNEMPVPELPSRYQEPGIHPYRPPENSLGNQERQSKDLEVSQKYEERIREFQSYFQSEKQRLEDDNLNQESTILTRILNTN